MLCSKARSYLVTSFRSCSSSSSSRSTSNLHNRHLRKRRKWPRSPYKAVWHESFNHQQAMETLKRSNLTSLLSDLIHSFSTYNCEPSPNAYYFVLKTLAKTSDFHQLNSVLDHLQNAENFETPEYFFVDSIKMYGDAGRFQDAIELFYKIPNFRCTPTVDSLNSLLSTLCRKRKGLAMVPQLIADTKSMNIRIEESTFRVLIKSLCRIKRADYAFELLKFMIDDEFSLDSRICSMILSTACNREDLSGVEVRRFLEEMRLLGFRPKGVDWCNVIRVLVNKGEGLDALNVLNHMKMDGIKPDIVCYTTVLDGVIAKGDYAKADKVFDEMLVLGLVPDISTYNVYISGLCKQNNFDAAIKMLACISEVGCKPNLTTYKTLLQALCLNDELTRAKDIVNEMECKGFKLNTQTYTIMISCLCTKYKLFEACSLLEDFLGKCFIPESSIFDEIIYDLCKKGWLERSIELLTEGIDKNVIPGVRAWEAVLTESGVERSFEDSEIMDILNCMHCSNGSRHL